jgi:cysteine desulfuration protein SufE
MDDSDLVESRLSAICQEMAELEPRERLELLLDFSENMPELPQKYAEERDQGLHRVHECQTPVFIWIEEVKNRCQVFSYVAPEAPTVKGFVAILSQILFNSRREDIQSLPPNLIQRLGLAEALGMIRARGLAGIVNYIQRLAKN